MKKTGEVEMRVPWDEAARMMIEGEILRDASDLPVKFNSEKSAFEVWSELTSSWIPVPNFINFHFYGVR